MNPDSGTPPRVFYRPVLVLVSLYLRTSWLNLFSNLLQSSNICHHINSTVSNFLLLYYFTCYCNELFIIFSNVLCMTLPCVACTAHEYKERGILKAELRIFSFVLIIWEILEPAIQ